MVAQKVVASVDCYLVGTAAIWLMTCDTELGYDLATSSSHMTDVWTSIYVGFMLFDAVLRYKEPVLFDVTYFIHHSIGVWSYLWGMTYKVVGIPRAATLFLMFGDGLTSLRVLTTVLKTSGVADFQKFRNFLYYADFVWFVVRIPPCVWLEYRYLTTNLYHPTIPLWLNIFLLTAFGGLICLFHYWLYAKVAGFLRRNKKTRENLKPSISTPTMSMSKSVYVPTENSSPSIKKADSLSSVYYRGVQKLKVYVF
jgi:hypothetical protein